MSALARLLRDRRGSAAAEMALIMPLLTVMLFATVEGGHYFWTEHQLIKSVRNGARFAARQDFANFTCGATSIGTQDSIVRNVVRTGTVNGTEPIVRDWDADGVSGDTISISVVCDTGSSYSNSGIYSDMSGAGATSTVDSAMKVQVIATVSYPSLFADLGFLNDRNLVARAQSPVTGF